MTGIASSSTTPSTSPEDATGPLSPCPVLIRTAEMSADTTRMPTAHQMAAE